MYSAQVHRHALDGMFKEWVFKTNNKRLCELLEIKAEQQSTFYPKPNITESGKYSLQVASHLLGCWETVMFEVGNQ